jgi:hypothetical protein
MKPPLMLRIVLVTVGLAGVGAACGALLGGLAFVVALSRIVRSAHIHTSFCRSAL